MKAYLNVSETNKFQKMREAVVEWFAFEVEEFRAGREHQTGKDLDELVLPGQTQNESKFSQRSWVCHTESKLS